MEPNIFGKLSRGCHPGLAAADNVDLWRADIFKAFKEGRWSGAKVRRLLLILLEMFPRIGCQKSDFQLFFWKTRL